MSEPPAFKEERHGAGWLVFAPEFEPFVRRFGLRDPQRAASLLALEAGRRAEPGASEGRAPTRILEVDATGPRLHLRRSRRGGLLGPLWCGRVPGIDRLRRELEHTAVLRARGAPVPRPALAFALRSGPLWRAGLATVHEEGSLDGVALLQRWRDGARRDELRPVAEAAGEAIRRFHQAGGCHRDLHIKNLLFRLSPDADADVVVIDLDGCRLLPGAPPPALRLRSLLRLQRSLRKRGLDQVVDDEACRAFLARYCAGDEALSRSLARRLATAAPESPSRASTQSSRRAG